MFEWFSHIVYVPYVTAAQRHETILDSLRTELSAIMQVGAKQLTMSSARMISGFKS